MEFNHLGGEDEPGKDSRESSQNSKAWCPREDWHSVPGIFTQTPLCLKSHLPTKPASPEYSFKVLSRYSLLQEASPTHLTFPRFCRLPIAPGAGEDCRKGKAWEFAI